MATMTIALERDSRDKQSRDMPSYSYYERMANINKQDTSQFSGAMQDDEGD